MKIQNAIGKPKISVITVVFNGERYLKETIESIITQNYANLEYVIVDGDSTDGTLSIIDKYKSHIDKFISEKDRGLSNAMNKGVKLSSGDWVLFLHADDTFTNAEAVNELVEVATKCPSSSWVTGYLQFQDSIGYIFRADNWHPISWKGMLLRNIVRHQATMVKRSAMLQIPFREEFRYAMDYDFFLRLWTRFGNPAVVKKHIVNFRLDGNNLSSNYYASLNDEMKVRLKFRNESRQLYIVPFDYLIYYLRYLKVKFVHKRTNVR